MITYYSTKPQIESKASTTRQRKIDKSELIKDVEQYPDAYQKERAERFGVALLNKSALADRRLPLLHLLSDPDALWHTQQRHTVPRFDYRHCCTYLSLIVTQAQMATQQSFYAEHAVSATERR